MGLKLRLRKLELFFFQTSLDYIFYAVTCDLTKK